jgi:hypothetical protein
VSRIVISMRQQVQWYLAEGLANIRARVDRPGGGQSDLASFAAKLDALSYVDEITEDERQDWYGRLLAALGIESSMASPGALGTSAQVLRPTGRSAVPSREPRRPAFVRMWLGPDREYALAGGEIRVISLELYDTMLSIRWRIAPVPELSALFPTEMAQFAHDVEGVEDWAEKELRSKAERRLWHRLLQFSLGDDAGTEYLRMGGNSSGGPLGWSGEAHFKPVPPDEATKLELAWFELVIELPLG